MRYFQMNFLEWKCMNFDESAMKFVPREPINSIGSDNGLPPTRRQTIIWTNEC